METLEWLLTCVMWVLSTDYHGGGQGGGIPPLEKIPYVVKLHPPPSKIAPYVVHPPSGIWELRTLC